MGAEARTGLIVLMYEMRSSHCASSQTTWSAVSGSGTSVSGSPLVFVSRKSKDVEVTNTHHKHRLLRTDEHRSPGRRYPCASSSGPSLLDAQE